MVEQQRNLFDTEPPPWEVDDLPLCSVAVVVFADTPYGPFDYRIPENLLNAVAVGQRLRVPLGRSNRSLVGYCVEIRHGVPLTGDHGRWKDLLGVIDRQPLLDARMLDLTKWLAEVCLCEWGQAIEGVVPAGVRANAGTRETVFLSVPIHVLARRNQLKLTPKQRELLQCLAASPQPLTPQELAARAACTLGPIQLLRKRGLIRSENVRVEQRDHALSAVPSATPVALNADQQQACDAVCNCLRQSLHRTFLLHGVTGSGKTEVYIRAIEEVIRYGRQAIVMVPEISLTPQTRERFQSRFERVALLHSHLSDAERHWHWRRIAQGEVQVVVGARSAVFAPVPDLGLIVLDEEHDASFKQDVTPRYDARDVAQFRARTLRIPLILGSATPSLESWWASENGAYQLIRLPDRVLNRPLPDVGIIDLRTEFLDRRNRGALSRPLAQAVQQVLRDQGQIILLLNRRGYSTSIQCPACGIVVRCPHCDIALTHHLAKRVAICHYCDYEIAAPQACPECRSDGIRYSGLGTQKLELEIAQAFPAARVQRMDSDTMQRPDSHEKVFEKFRNGEIDILVGTQMIAKGHDFPNVMLVGVVNADTSLHFPDFRASERTFHLVTQVAGRTGRGDRGGRVLVQTFSPDHPAIVHASRHDFEAFARSELAVRQQYGYPPMSVMVRLVVRGERDAATSAFAESLGQRLSAAIGSGAVRVLGPAPAPLARLRGKYRYHLLLLGSDPAELRALVRPLRQACKPPDDVQWIADPNPQDML